MGKNVHNLREGWMGGRVGEKGERVFDLTDSVFQISLALT